MDEMGVAGTCASGSNLWHRDGAQSFETSVQELASIHLCYHE